MARTLYRGGTGTGNESKTLFSILSGYNSNSSERGGWAFSMTNRAWTWIKSKTTYKLVLDTPNGKHWTVEFTGYNDPDPNLFAMVDKDVVNAFSQTTKGKVVRIHQGDSVLAIFQLNNSGAAIHEVVHCVNEHPPTKTTTAPTENEHNTSFGTGFFIANNYVLTAWHVLENCTTKFHVKYPGYNSEDARTAGKDEVNDLILLKTNMANDGIATFRFKPKLGEQVASFGFPFAKKLSTGGNFTLGNVTAIVGIGDDTSKFQLSAALQPGNSGGPILNSSGRVLGISQMVMGTLKMAELEGGAIPQNVNFAISSAIAVKLLTIKDINPQIDLNDPKKLEPEILAEIAKKFTVQVFCE